MYMYKICTRTKLTLFPLVRSRSCVTIDFSFGARTKTSFRFFFSFPRPLAQCHAVLCWNGSRNIVMKPQNHESFDRYLYSHVRHGLETCRCFVPRNIILAGPRSTGGIANVGFALDAPGTRYLVPRGKIVHTGARISERGYVRRKRVRGVKSY